MTFSIGNKQHFLLAVDPSLTSSGWALFSLADGEPLATGIIGAPGAALPLVERLNILQSFIDQLFVNFRIGQGDYLVCEGAAPLVLNPNSAMKVEQVRGVFETLARTYSVCVPGRINPRTLQSEILGLKGKQLARPIVKSIAREAVSRLFGTAIKKIPHYRVLDKKLVLHTPTKIPQDVVDALLIGVLASSRVSMALAGKMPVETAFLPKKRQGGNRKVTRWSDGDIQTLLRR